MTRSSPSRIARRKARNMPSEAPKMPDELGSAVQDEMDRAWELLKHSVNLEPAPVNIVDSGVWNGNPIHIPAHTLPQTLPPYTPDQLGYYTPAQSNVPRIKKHVLITHGKVSGTSQVIVMDGQNKGPSWCLADVEDVLQILAALGIEVLDLREEA